MRKIYIVNRIDIIGEEYTAGVYDNQEAADKHTEYIWEKTKDSSCVREFSVLSSFKEAVDGKSEKKEGTTDS